MPQGLVTE